MLINWDGFREATKKEQNYTIVQPKCRLDQIDAEKELSQDRDNDTMEWRNLADDPRFFDVKEGLKYWLPKDNVPNSPRENREQQLKRMKDMGIQLP